MQTILFNDEEYREILHQLEQLTRSAEQLPDEEAKELIFSILKYFDLLHREALSRMMEAIRQDPNLADRLESDFTIRTLLSLYDLAKSPVQGNEQSPVVGFVPEEQVRIL